MSEDTVVDWFMQYPIIKGKASFKRDFFISIMYGQFFEKFCFSDALTPPRYPNLNIGRKNHGCGYYRAENYKIVS